MSNVSNVITVDDVTRIHTSFGYAYRAVVPIEDIYELQRKAVLRYSPRYQRGFKKKLIDDLTPADYDRLLPLYDASLQIDPKRAHAMAAKYLLGLAPEYGKQLYSLDLYWNARKELGSPELEYDPDEATLKIHSSLTVPDSGHRHLCFFYIGRWKDHPEEIPAQIDVDGTPITSEIIQKLLAEVNLDDRERHARFVTIYNLDEVDEGRLYDEFNSDSRPPSGAKAIDLNRHKTPTRRFIYALIEKSAIFGEDEIETQVTNIGSRSRKLTTNATMDAAISPFKKRLVKLEQGSNAAYADLVDFFGAYFAEWARHYPAFQPGATKDDRWGLREKSFALSNIMFFPLFRIAFELWEWYRDEGKDWRVDNLWKNALAKLAGKLEVDDPEDPGKTMIVDVMSRGNPDWRDTILVKKFKQDGSVKGWSLSSTSQTRAGAYHYLCNVANLKEILG